MSQKVYRSGKQKVSAVNEISLSISQGIAVREACKKAEIPMSSYYRWRQEIRDNPEYLDNGEIPQRSRRPKRLARQVTQITKEKVIELADMVSYTSAANIQRQLGKEGISIGTGTVIKILEEAGLYGEIHVFRNGEKVRKHGLLKLDERSS